MDTPSTKPVPATEAGVKEQEKAEPSGYRGDNPATAGPGATGVRAATPENSTGAINPSSPGDTGTTPGTTPRQS